MPADDGALGVDATGGGAIGQFGKEGAAIEKLAAGTAAGTVAFTPGMLALNCLLEEITINNPAGFSHE